MYTKFICGLDFAKDKKILMPSIYCSHVCQNKKWQMAKFKEVWIKITRYSDIYYYVSDRLSRFSELFLCTNCYRQMIFLILKNINDKIVLLLSKDNLLL